MPLQRRPDPPISNSVLALQQAWHKLIDIIDTELGEVGFSNVLWVDQNDGDDDSAQRGSLSYKYETIQGALDAAQAGDVVWVSPGTYQEDITWPTIDNVTLRGMGVSTILLNNTAVDTITMAPTLGITLATIEHMSILNTGAHLAINVDGTISDLSFTSALNLRDLLIPSGDGISVETANNVRINDINGGPDLVLTSVSAAQLETCNLGNITITYALAPATAPTDGPGTLSATAVIADGVLTVTGLPRVAFGKDVQVGSVVGHLLDTAAWHGWIWFNGHVATDVNVDFAYVNDVSKEGLRFDYSQIGGQVTVADAGTSTCRCEAKFRHAELLDTTGPHTAGDLCDMDLRGGLFAQASLAAAGDGGIDRSMWVISEDAGSGAADAAVAIDPPLVGTSYQVSVEGSAIADLPVKTDSHLAASFHRTKTADNGLLIYRISMPYG